MTFYNDIYPFYTLQRTSFIFSGSLLTVILVFLVLAVSLLVILPGIRGKSVSVHHQINHYSLQTQRCLLFTVHNNDNIVLQRFHLNVSFHPFILVYCRYPSFQRLFWMIRIIISLFIGAVIVGEYLYSEHCCIRKHRINIPLHLFMSFFLQLSTSLVTGLRPE